ncbi:MAG: DUF1549 domain-containing protein, partial [Planctomycetota bacterium]|nr:DUF1549 domain-containing protein [Planctomycetota bacterium]
MSALILRSPILASVILICLAQQTAAQQNQRHWSFEPLRTVSVPHLDSGWPRNPIDSFILEKLDAAGLSPAEQASPNQLTKRLYLDMLGVFPEVSRLSKLSANLSEEAWIRLIDEVLASPAYGERWGRHWLDLARYADSNGFEFDFVRPYAWRYRDYVISAFNRDKPYDQFIKEQLAGDELHRSKLEAWVATGFCRNGPTVGNQTLDKNRYEELHDVITATTEVFLGLTVGCARCHDHKFDPISQKDYYSLLAIFHTIGRRDQFLGTPEERNRYDMLRQEKKALEEKLGTATNELQAGDWRREGQMLVQSSMVNNTRVWFGDKAWNQYTLEIEFQRTKVTDQALSFDAGVYVSVLADKYDQGYTLQLGASDGREHAMHYEIDNGRHLLVPRIAGKLMNNQWYRLRIEVSPGLKKVWLDGKILFEFEDRRHSNGGITLGNWSTNTKWRNLRVVNKSGKVLLDGFPAVAEMRRPEANQGFNTETVKKEIQQIERQLAGLPLAQAITDTSSMATPTNLHIRGEYDNPGAPVLPAVPAAVAWEPVGFPDAEEQDVTTGRRLILANWIAHENNPLTARVMANRIWQYHFGRGLVETSSNFGLLGFEPTHPELLDWLAGELIRSDWSVKHLHRLILESATYQQASFKTSFAREDPEAKLLSRFPMRRHDAEVIRDRILQAAGSLNFEMGGPGIHPYIPEDMIGTGTTRKWPRVEQ